MPIAIQLSTAADIGVTVGTAALAAATFFMARAAKSQAKNTERLAEIAARQYASTLPRLRIVRNDGQVVVTGQSKRQQLSATYENHGGSAAFIHSAGLGEQRGTSRINPVPPGQQAVVDVPDSPMGSGPDRVIELRFGPVHGGPVLTVRTEIEAMHQDQWAFISEEEKDDA